MHFGQLFNRQSTFCACVGGASKVPLGFISLTENLMMIAMAVWMVLGATGNVRMH